MGMRASSKITLQVLTSIVKGGLPEKVQDALAHLFIYAEASIPSKDIAILIGKHSTQRANTIIDGLLNEVNVESSERAKDILRKVLDSQIDVKIKEKIMKSGYIQPIQHSKSNKK
jgi:hypothetical protein